MMEPALYGDLVVEDVDNLSQTRNGKRACSSHFGVRDILNECRGMRHVI